ncbi:MAG: hypothetical protein RLZZ171_1642, partial [Cyanobacteriota bacterium]
PDELQRLAGSAVGDMGMMANAKAGAKRS